MIPGAFACLMALIFVVALICIAWEKCRDAKLDRDIRRAFKEADRLGWLDEYKTRVARFYDETTP